MQMSCYQRGKLLYKCYKKCIKISCTFVIDRLCYTRKRETRAGKAQMEITLAEGIKKIEAVEVNNCSIQVVTYTDHANLRIWHHGYADGTLTIDREQAQQIIDVLSAFVEAGE